ncbi:CC115 protein, partial [Polypterus senegalus]|nr:CC115 protein [Polypterus senegalus]
MDQLENLQEKQGLFNELIKQGWFSLSKACYSMGNKCVLCKMDTSVAVSKQTPHSNEKSAPEKKTKRSWDLGKWFGILMPQTLKQGGNEIGS